ncbi:SAM-dependent methyltransferase [Candidatus Pelagibacter bacterium]|nr:SAM-dependent methyltransferase [Candidatus Pelagibacter bacterium]MDA8832101.1 SAM-dependent methyltransferase [Candidatus Pelagibacter bacterium]MDB2709784.1 SAM-dependent methyltransferase [Candidatus Pelagibacter bacterium]
MKIKNNQSFTLDKFIEESLYNKTSGYYMKKNPFGKKGDFITSPNISVLFSEMIAIWVVSFWQNLGCPKKFNLIELGAGNGEMMKVLVNTFEKFQTFKNSCHIKILERSKLLRKKQKININKKNIQWLNDLSELDNSPCIFLANEFFDALPIKQFIKKERKWFERHVRFFNNKFEYFDVPFDMEKFENKIKFKITNQQNFIEYSPQSTEYLKIIFNKIKSNNGGILIIDYAYTDKKMKNTLQAVSKHKYCDVLKGFGNSDITYNLSFSLLNRIVKELSSLTSMNTTQGEFLTKLGILERAEILSKKMLFSEKADIYFRIKRLIDKNQMGELFKVMLITANKNKFKLGF